MLQMAHGPVRLVKTIRAPPPWQFAWHRAVTYNGRLSNDSGLFSMQPLVGLIMGSKSDWPTMEHAANMLEKLGVAYETKVVSAHRTPDLLFDYAKTAADRGLKVIIAGAGGAAHLPGMVASQTALPVLGVPVQSK